MGRKKPTAREEENPIMALQGGAKSKKKALAIDDDEYAIGSELSQEPEVDEEKVQITGKKKGKKGASKPQKKDAEDEEQALEEDNAVAEVVLAGKKKSKSKKVGGGNQFSGFGLLEEDKEGSEGEGKSGLTDRGDSETLDEPKVISTGNKKVSKKGNTGGSLFSALDEVDDDDEGKVVDGSAEKSDSENGEEVPPIAFSGKKKPSKGKKKGNSALPVSSFVGLDDEQDENVAGEEDEMEDIPSVVLTGNKKKSGKSKRSGNSFSATLLDEEDDGETSLAEHGGASAVITGSEDATIIAFTGKKKSSKKKSSSGFMVMSEESEVTPESKEESVATTSTEPNYSRIYNAEDTLEISKNKKKKKKGGRTVQEEEDLDTILAELGEAPPISNVERVEPPQNVEVQRQAAAQVDANVEKDGEEEGMESAAAKKKKKKKEKEKEKKAAAAAAAATDTKEETQEETKIELTDAKKKDGKSKAAEKKQPKRVREIQEQLARMRELEERKKREEEERVKKEEEERRRQEELERQVEEARRRKKEKEKERIARKKLEGKYLTDKQKEEARRLEAMRNQILASVGGLPVATSDNDAPAKRKPIYSTKKSKANNRQANGVVSLKTAEDAEVKETEPEEQKAVVEIDSVEREIEEEKSVNVEEKSETEAGEGSVVEDEDEDEDEWDAKSWDDINLSVKGALEDEEGDSEPDCLVKKNTRATAPNSRCSGPSAGTKQTAVPNKASSSESVKDQEENKRIQTTVEAPSKDRKKRVEVLEENKKDNAIKPKAETSDSHARQGEQNLRSPICCIMGHVDTGKTKLLDCIRGTNVQEGEAGGITQQIGATYFPAENIRERTRELKADATLKVPGLLVIDTPGHESFTNLRSRGSGLCDIAILVVDIMHGLEPQTIESLNLLKMRNTEFIVALNKVDRLYGWKSSRNAPIVKTLKQQSKDVQNEFNMRVKQVMNQFQEQGLNTELYYKNKEMGETFSIVPTSAITGEGIPDLLLLLVQWTQKTMVEKLLFSEEVQCTVLEVKVVEGYGTTIDVVLVNGVLHEGDQIVVCGSQGPIVTTIRALLTPHPMKELRVKGSYLHYKEIKASQGIKIAAQGLEHAVAGTGLYVVEPDDNIDDVKKEAMEDMNSVMSRIDTSGEGVCVQASTLGSLEALLEFLKSPEVNIPVSCISIGPVHKKDVIKASVMLEKKKEYATILAFDVKVTPEARELAGELGVTIFIADIIYHLFDQFKAYINALKEERKKEAADEAVFPCVLKILPNCIFNKKDPIVLGVDVLEGIARVGTPLCIPSRDFIDIGQIASIENNHKPVESAKKNSKVAIKIVGTNPEEEQKMYGRHFEVEDELVSHLSRRSIDVLKANYRDELSNEEWRLVVKLKKLLDIP